MFEQLSEKMLASFDKLKGKSRISEANIEEAIKEIRFNLLEADVNFKVVKNFIERVKAKSLGLLVQKGIEPGQQFVKIVHDELVAVLGNEKVDVDFRHKPSVIFMVGLQGAGKTTTSAKLALFARQKFGKRPGLVSCDIYRPAAMDQLATLAKANNVPIFMSAKGQGVEEILKGALDWAKKEQLDVLIVDTAGRLQVDEALMAELAVLKNLAQPHEILLVADAMLGQQSVQVAEGFHRLLNLTGLILTKVDGDARGGAALSIREVTGIPIKFLGMGEKVGALEVFHPDRLASRILDMGDVLSLVEKAQELIDEKSAKQTAQKMLRNEFTVEDFLAQMQMLKKMGGFESMLKFLPGMGQISKQIGEKGLPDKELKKTEAIIRSMTQAERRDHRILNASRRVRIAKGSGTEVKDVNRFIKQFEESKKMMGSMMKMFGGKKGGGLMGGKGGFGSPF